MNPHDRNGTQAFTLVEVLVVGGLTVLISVATLEWLSRETDAWEMATTQLELQDAAKAALGTMSAELRNATRKVGATPPTLSIPGAAPNNTSIQFYLPADSTAANFTTIRVVDAITGAVSTPAAADAITNTSIVDDNGNTEWDAANAMQYVYNAAGRQVWRQVNGVTTRVLANEVTAATFDHQLTDPSLSSTEVRMRLTLQRTTPHRRVVSVSTSSMVALRN